MQRTITRCTDVFTGVAEGCCISSVGSNATRSGKIHHSEYEAVILQSCPIRKVYALAFQVCVGVIRPCFVNHTGHEAKGKGRVDVIPTALANAAKPTEGAKDVERIFQGVENRYTVIMRREFQLLT